MLKNFMKKHWHATMVIYFFIYLPWFSWLNIHSTTQPNAIEMYCKLDDLIPFNEWFVIPYFLWFAYIAIGYVFLFFNNKSDFLRMCLFLYVGMTICLIVYTFFPNYQNLRVDYEALGRRNILTEAIRLLQLGDTNYNVFPSIHCLNSIGMNIALAKNEWCKKRPWLIVLVTLLTVSICLSTVFVKQHSILDMFGAIGLSIPLYLISYVIPWHKLIRTKVKKECA